MAAKKMSSRAKPVLSLSKGRGTSLVVTGILSAMVSTATTASLIAFGGTPPMEPREPGSDVIRPIQNSWNPMMRLPEKTHGNNPPSWSTAPSLGNQPSQRTGQSMMDPCAHLKKQEYKREYKKEYQKEYQQEYERKEKEVKSEKQKPSKQDVIRRLFENIRAVMEGAGDGKYRMREEVKKVLREVGFDEHEIAKLEAALAARLKEMNEQEPRPTPSAR